MPFFPFIRIIPSKIKGEHLMFERATQAPLADSPKRRRMALIELRDVRRRFPTDGGSHAVLQGVDLDVEAGEFVAVVGHSGSGKSTLLNIIGGLDRADAGSVTVEGVSLSGASDDDLDAHRRDRVGFVFQSFHVNPRRTSLENVLVPLVFGPVAGADDRALGLERLRRVGLEAFADRPVSTLSGGQRQRVAVARALVRSPRVLLADEPVGNLDAATGSGIVALLQEINRAGGVTVVTVSHDRMLLDAASRVLTMRDGQLTEMPYVAREDA